MSDTRVRWRMTLDELAYECHTTPITLERWAQLGALGPRWKEPRDRGKWRHITREAAQRAVIMSRLVRAGLLDEPAAAIAALHQVGDLDPYLVSRGAVEITVSRDDLP